MEFWDNIVHTALLGTDKMQVQPQHLEEDLAAAYELTINSGDKEDQFLGIAAIALNYRKCGNQPLTKNIVPTIAEDEAKRYCSTMAHEVLKDIISAESQPLLGFWLSQCNTADQIILPEYIPMMFDLALKYTQLQQQIVSVTGKRGEWLLPLNEAWKFEATASADDVWQTGTLDMRRQYLHNLRQSAPGEARELLQKTWPVENANTKAELVKQLSVSLSNADLPWLEELMQEKSQKVKDEVLKLLKKLPGSTIVQQYWSVVKNSITIQKRSLLSAVGLSPFIDIRLADNIDEGLFKSGIEKVSSEKGVDDNHFILYQLVAAVPPVYFEEHYQLSKQQLIDLFNKSKEGRRFVAALGLSAVKFEDAAWLRAIIYTMDKQFYPEALLLLPLAEQEQYALRFLDDKEAADAVLHYILLHLKRQWSLPLTRAIFTHTAQNAYRYHRAFYKEQIMHFPAEIVHELDRLAPKEDYAKEQWAKISEYIARLLNLREQTNKAFQP